MLLLKFDYTTMTQDGKQLKILLLWPCLSQNKVRSSLIADHNYITQDTKCKSISSNGHTEHYQFCSYCIPLIHNFLWRVPGLWGGTL